jgi:hypothetical protein
MAHPKVFEGSAICLEVPRVVFNFGKHDVKLERLMHLRPTVIRLFLFCTGVLVFPCRHDANTSALFSHVECRRSNIEVFLNRPQSLPSRWK